MPDGWIARSIHTASVLPAVTVSTAVPKPYTPTRTPICTAINPSVQSAVLSPKATDIQAGWITRLIHTENVLPVVTVNTAARLESNAKRGQILISQEVYDNVKDRVEVTPIGELPLKGKEVGVFIYQVDNVR